MGRPVAQMEALDALCDYLTSNRWYIVKGPLKKQICDGFWSVRHEDRHPAFFWRHLENSPTTSHGTSLPVSKNFLIRGTLLERVLMFLGNAKKKKNAQLSRLTMKLKSFSA